MTARDVTKYEEKKRTGGGVTFLTAKPIAQSSQFSRWDIGNRYGVER